MRIALPILVAAAWLNASVALTAEVSSGLDPNQPYQAQRTNPVTYQVDLRILVTPPAKTKRLQVWLPLPEGDFGQEVQDRKLETLPQSVEPQIATEERFGNTFAWFNFDNPQGAQQIRHTFQAKVWELRWQLDPERIPAIEE